MFKITRQEWKDIPRDYKYIENKQRYIMILDKKCGTCLTPVEITKEEFSNTKSLEERYYDEQENKTENEQDVTEEYGI